MQKGAGTGMDCLPFIIPPRGRLASAHPRSNLLGFSAALAPKFHPELLEALAGWLTGWQAGRAEEELLDEERLLEPLTGWPAPGGPGRPGEARAPY